MGREVELQSRPKSYHRNLVKLLGHNNLLTQILKRQSWSTGWCNDTTDRVSDVGTSIGHP
jgi:hypothetical protein